MNHRDTETQREHREKRENWNEQAYAARASLFQFSLGLFSVLPLCLCVSVVHLLRAMKAFEFRLESILKLQQRKQRLAELQRLAAQQAVIAADREVQRLHEEIRRHAEVIGPSLDRGELSGLEAASARASWLGTALAAAEQQVRARQLALARADEQLRTAAIKVETLQTLKQRRWQEHRAARAAAEQQRVEEFVLRRWLDDTSLHRKDVP